MTGDVPLRVMLVNGNYADGTVGGTQTFTQNLARSLADEGHEVAVLCQGDRDDVGTDGGITVFRVRPPRLELGSEPYAAYLVNQSLAIQNPVIGRKVHRAVRAFAPELCHVQMLRRLTPTVLAVLRRHPTAVVQTVHEPFSLWNFNAYQREDSPDKLFSARPRVVDAFRWRHRELSRHVQHVCSPSRGMLDHYLDDGYFRGVPATVVPNSVPFEWGDPLAAADGRDARPGTGVDFLFIGRLDHYKGVELLLAAFGELTEPGVRLHVAGEGVLEGTVRAHAARDPRIVFHGPVRGTARLDLMRRADVLVCPSTWFEAFGLVVLEAYAAGMPVVSSRAGALPELVRDGGTGLTVPVGDVPALAGALRRMCDPGTRRAMGRAAARRVWDFHPDRFLRRQLDIYRRVRSTRLEHPRGIRNDHSVRYGPRPTDR
ncbi:glycosyltransferase [Longispora urticae]